MPETAAAAGKRKATPRSAAARAEVNGHAMQIKWHGRTFEIPAEPPGDLAFSIENNEASAAIQEIFGDEQYSAIREQMKTDGLSYAATFEAIRDILADCFSKWGTTEGE